MKATTTKLNKPSHIVSASNSEKKLDFLRRQYRQTQLDIRLSPTRKASVFARLCQKAAWHQSNIAAWNRVTVQFGDSLNVAM